MVANQGDKMNEKLILKCDKQVEVDKVVLRKQFIFKGFIWYLVVLTKNPYPQT